MSSRGTVTVADLVRVAVEEGVRVSDAPILDGSFSPDGFEPKSLDLGLLLEAGVPEPEYLSRPYLPAGVSIWIAGGSEAGKSLWALARCCELSHGGIPVVYVSQENPLTVEHRRLGQLRPDPEHFRMFHDQGFDLAVPGHVQRLVTEAKGAALIVLDTFTACWSGDENDTAAVVGFDRDVVRPLIRDTGASVLTLDHMGHPQILKRQGVNAPRGSSAKGQKADFLLHFKAAKGNEFTIEHGKNRLGGMKEPPRRIRVVDTQDGGLELVEIAAEPEVDYERLAERASEMVDVNPDHYTKSSLAAALGGRRQDALVAIEQLLADGRIGPNVARAHLTSQERP